MLTRLNRTGQGRAGHDQHGAGRMMDVRGLILVDLILSLGVRIVHQMRRIPGL